MTTTDGTKKPTNWWGSAKRNDSYDWTVSLGGGGQHTNPAKAAKIIKHHHAYSICCRPEVA